MGLLLFSFLAVVLLSREKCMQNFHDTSFYLSKKFYLSILLVQKILLVHSTCPKNSTCPFYLSLFLCLKAKKIDTELVSFSERDKNLLIEPASPIFSGARATSREISRDESAIFPDGADQREDEHDAYYR